MALPLVGSRTPSSISTAALGPAGGDLVRGGDDGLALGRLEDAEVHVDERRGLLHEHEGPDEGGGHALARDPEVAQRALGLRPPEAVRGDIDRAERVAFDAVLGRGLPASPRGRRRPTGLLLRSGSPLATWHRSSVSAPAP